jgi:DNA-binding CsgD family transcriptional regulator
MNNISSVLLSDTLKLIQLARETARVQGQPEQAEKLKPVVEQLKSLAEGANQAKVTAAPQKTTAQSLPPSGGILAQEDFKTLLSAVQKSQNQPPTNLLAGLRPTSSLERNQIVVSMASGGMSALDIARQMGMTIDEVNMVIRLNQKSTENRKEVSA